VDKSEGRFFTSWDGKNRKFILQLYFLEKEQVEQMMRRSTAVTAAAPRPVLRYDA
jgi:hypothetical protein